MSANAVAQGLAGLEARHAGRRDLDLLARAWVAPIARRPASHDERAEELECGERNASGVTPFPFIRLEPILVRDLAEAAAIPSLEKYVPADDEPKIVTLRIQQAAGTIDLLWFVAKSDGRWTWFLGSTAIGRPAAFAADA